MIGPPLLFHGKLDESMKQEHTACDDSSLEFTSSNGVTTTSATEWEVAIAPQVEVAYPDRESFAVDDPRRRVPRAIEELLPAMAERNERLEAHKQTPMVKDELIAARLYTGPMCEAVRTSYPFQSGSHLTPAPWPRRYHKYNLVLRSRSGVSFLKLQFERECKGNLYATTIHGINSAVIKLSKLQVACPVYRGSTRAVLPAQFWQKDDLGLSGGVEFGFTSTTVERAQAVHYAQGQASLILESLMGLIDRGADIRCRKTCAPHTPSLVAHDVPVCPWLALAAGSRSTLTRERCSSGRCWGSSRSRHAWWAARSWWRRECRST